MPPLRERPGDPQLLAEHFLRRLSEEYQRPPKRVHPMTLEWLERYEWPGNVRELENLVSREFFLAETDEILFTGDESTAPAGAGEPSDYRTARARALAAFHTAFLTALLTRHRGNITRAAEAAGKERRALSRLLKKYRIEPRRTA
jgi:DNA-binding NtrC family response regulator